MRTNNVKKNKFARLVSALLLLIPFGISIWMIILLSLTTSNIDYVVNIVSVAILIFFTILEIFILLKNLKKELIILNMIYNTNDTINTGALIFNNVFMFIALVLIVGPTIIYFNTTSVDVINSCYVIIPMAVYVLINTIIYDLYILIFRFKKFEVTDLA